MNLTTHIENVECFMHFFKLDMIVSYNSISNGHVHVFPCPLCHL